MSEPTSRAWLGPFFRSLTPTFREVLAISFFVNVLALAVPVFVLQVYDRVVFHAGISTLQGLVIGMAVVLVFDYMLRQSRARIMQTVALRADVVVGRRLFDKLMSLPLRTLENQPAAYWHALFRDLDVVRNTVSGASAILIVDLPFAILFLGLIYVIAAPIAWVLLIVLPLFLLVAWRSGSAVSAASRAERDSGLARDRLVAEMIGGRTTVKALNLEAAMRPLWEQRHADTIERAITRGSRADGYANLGTTLTMMTTVALTGFGALAIINQELTIGALIATNILSGRLLGPLTQLVGTWRTYAGFCEAAERLGKMFAAPSERTESKIELQRPKGELTLENVTFAYSQDDKPTIDNVRLTLRCPGVYGLIGRNGSGKTTLLKLIQGLYPPSTGRILLDDADIAQFGRAELATWISYVPQECVLFAGTLRDNIAHRKPDTTDEEVVAAARAAGAHSFIVDLADGYGAEVGEAGQRLSAGQRQRIAIARALIGDPPVLLFDEPSSNLDRHAEQEIGDLLADLGRTRTVVIVTHSSILLTRCSSVIALDKGRIALAGPAKEVLPRLFGTGESVARRAAGAAPATTSRMPEGGPSPAAATPRTTILRPVAADPAPRPTDPSAGPRITAKTSGDG